MVCFHQSEWGVEFSHLKSEIDTFLDKGINKEEDEGIKNILIERKNEALQITEAKVNALSFWKEVKVSGNSMPEGVTYEPHTNSCRKMHSWETEPILQPGESPSTLEQFPTNNKVYHFHPNMFVRQMRRLGDGLNIQVGIEWLESIAVTKDDLGKDSNYYKVSYKNDTTTKTRTALTKVGEKNLDCSELVCRYLQKIGWSKDVKWLNTKGLYNYAEKYPEHLEKQKKDYKPQIGDIFLWKKDSGMGHTGVVVKYDETTDSVTTIESINENEYPSRVARGENSGHGGYNFKGVI